MKIFKILALILCFVTIEAAIKKQFIKHTKAKLVSKQARKASHFTALPSQRQKLQKGKRQLLLENINLKDIPGKAVGAITGLSGIVLTRLEREEQREEMRKISAQIHNQASDLMEKKRNLQETVTSLDEKIERIRNDVRKLGENIDEKILQYQKAIKTKLNPRTQ